MGRSDEIGLLYSIYFVNKDLIDSLRMRKFFDAVAALGLAFTELQVRKLADSSGMFPSTTNQTYSGDEEIFPPFQPQFGEYSRATYGGNKLEGWEPLGTGRYLEAGVRIDKVYQLVVKSFYRKAAVNPIFLSP